MNTGTAQRPAGSVTGHAQMCAAAPAHEARRRFWLLWLLLVVLKLILAATLAPFADEAFYWQESRHPALSYSDLPALTAWLIRGSETLFGHSVLAMRAPFLLLGALLPLLVVQLAGRLGVTANAWRAGSWALLLPLAGGLGVLALPDVPLTVAVLGSACGLERCISRGWWRDWLAGGCWLGIAGLAHYRAAILWLALLVVMLAYRQGRQLWRQPGLWLAGLLGAAGLLPTLWFNMRSDWSGLSFQALDRHPWRLQAEGLLQMPEQTLVTTPFLYLLLLAGLVATWRRHDRQPTWLVVGGMAGTFIIGYFLLGLFADNLRFRVHWPLPGYLLLAATLPALLDEWRLGAHTRWLAALRPAAAVLAAAGLALVFAWLALAAIPAASTALAWHKAYPANLVGWREAGEKVRELLATQDDAVLVADNFKLAAQLDFQLGGSTVVYSLDHVLNAKHGRATQLRIWQRDEQALRRLPMSTAVLLAVDETAGRERHRREWLSGLCTGLGEIEPVGRVELHDGARRFAFYRAVLTYEQPTDSCIIWDTAYRAMQRHGRA